ncbi:MAG: hypothetical protein FJ267_15785 [Planctomycetes bacterium]|nr:hypothetical protein [Planctomycetota bacterium]
MKSRQIWRINQPNVYQRELRPFLTGRVYTQIRGANSQFKDVTHRTTSYDTMSLESSQVVRALTFHEESGGIKYTGLTNHLLFDEDVSHLIKLDRAIVYGRLSDSVTKLEIRHDESGQDDSKFETRKPDNHHTFVRLVLPVKKKGEIPQFLESFDPQKQKSK